MYCNDTFANSPQFFKLGHLVRNFPIVQQSNCSCTDLMGDRDRPRVIRPNTKSDEPTDGVIFVFSFLNSNCIPGNVGI